MKSVHLVRHLDHQMLPYLRATRVLNVLNSRQSPSTLQSCQSALELLCTIAFTSTLVTHRFWGRCPCIQGSLWGPSHLTVRHRRFPSSIIVISLPELNLGFAGRAHFNSFARTADGRGSAAPKRASETSTTSLSGGDADADVYGNETRDLRGTKAAFRRPWHRDKRWWIRWPAQVWKVTEQRFVPQVCLCKIGLLF